MSKKNNKWFKKVRGSYIPVTTQGWLSYIPYVGFLILSYLYVMSAFGYSLISFFIILPNWVAAAAVMSWYAQKRS